MTHLELVDPPAVVRRRVPAALLRIYEREERRLLDHPFLRRCASGEISMNELRRYLVQQGHYGGYFTRYLCGLISQLPEGDDVLRLAANLAEELGLGDGQGVSHSRLYADMLTQFDLSLKREPITPQTQSLVDTMFMLCRQPGGESGLGALCLGAEAVVPAMYQRILDGFAHHRVPAAKLAFFEIHVGCDDEHAQTMFDILASWCNRPAAIETIAAAAATAISARLRMFDALLEQPIALAG